MRAAKKLAGQPPEDGVCRLREFLDFRVLSVRLESVPDGSATSYFETGLTALLSMRLQRLCPHAEERRSRVSKYELAPPAGPDSN